MGPSGLLAPCASLAFAAAIMSFLVAGIVNPLALYAQRVVLFNAESLALTGGAATGQFYILKRVWFCPAAHERRFSRTEKASFIYEPRGTVASRLSSLGAPDRPVVRQGYSSTVFDNVSWRIFDIERNAVASAFCPAEAESFITADRRIRLADLLSLSRGVSMAAN